MCINCNEVYHTSCALRAGLTVAGKSNHVKCCFSKENIEASNSAMNIETYKNLVETKDEIIQSKRDIIFQLKANGSLLYKTLNILDKKTESRLTKISRPIIKIR